MKDSLYKQLWDEYLYEISCICGTLFETTPLRAGEDKLLLLIQDGYPSVRIHSDKLKENEQELVSKKFRVIHGDLNNGKISTSPRTVGVNLASVSDRSDPVLY